MYAVEPVENAVDKFEKTARQSALHLLDPVDFQPERGGLGVPLEITSKDLSTGLYEQRMAQAGSSGRRIYDRLQIATPRGTCPLCGVRPATTLDHHLPRSSFAALSVAPLNLIPACFECNRVKLSKRPLNEREQTLNPYFENAADARWLYCRITETPPVIAGFTVRPPADWAESFRARVNQHFEVFRLDEIYSFHASRELAGMSRLHADLVDALGKAGLKTHLSEVGQSAQGDNLNSWKGAMYEALADNDWYCSGNFKLPR